MLGISRGAWGWLGVVGLAVGAVVWQGCGDSQSADARDGAAADVATAAVVPTPQVATELDETDIKERATHSTYARDPGFVSLDERILRSNVIARATMRSVEAYASGRYTPKKYNPMLRFTFDVHEYLKGSGGSVITADIEIPCTQLNWARCNSFTEQESIDYANVWIDLSSVADRWWANRESIIFLEEDDLSRSEVSGQSASTMYKFIPWNEYHNYATTNLYPYANTDGFSVLSGRNRVWLPATAASSGASRVSESRFMLGRNPRYFWQNKVTLRTSWFATDISLADLKSRVKEVADMVKQGEGVEGYEECLRRKFREFRDPFGPYAHKFQIQSGQWAGRVVDSRLYTGNTSSEYDIYFFEGDDKRFFEFDIEDDDSDPINGYYRTLKIARPLVSGNYSVRYHHMPGSIKPCIDASVGGRRDVPVANVTWIIRSTAPAGTLHEAFFDPVAIGAVVGADRYNGALTPAAFSATSGVDVYIRRVDWESAAVTIEITNPPVSLLANHHIDFIALDGSIPLRLDFDDAAVADDGGVRTFSWVVCGRPWHAGDKLMLRISESPPDLAGATNRASCSDAAAEQTPTPIPTTTPTPETGAAGQ